jgi:hypothetical protein
MSNPLGYATDYGVMDFNVSPYYQTLNQINRAGPAPNAIYGPGSWVNILSTAILSSGTGTGISWSDGSSTTNVSTTAATTAYNQDLPGLGWPLSSSAILASPLASTTTTSCVLSTAGVNALPLQIKFTAASSSTLGGTLAASTVYYTYFTMQNPSLSKFNPNGVVNGVYFAGTTTGVYTTGTTSSVVNVPGAAWNVSYTYASSAITAQATSFTFSTYGTVAAILGSTTDVNDYFPQFSLYKLTTSDITTLNSLSSATIIIPQLNTYNSNVFALFITFPSAWPTTIAAGYPLAVNVPLQGFYTCPQYADVTFSY